MMNTSDSKAISSQPKLWPSIGMGFSVVANHLVLLLFPVFLDLWIWLGYHVSMRTLLSDWLDQMTAFTQVQTAQMTTFTAMVRELLLERLNLMVALRSYPVGIPSLMSSVLPIETPLGQPLTVDIVSLSAGVVLFLGLTVLGLAFGSFYYLVVAQAALHGKPQWGSALRKLPWVFWQVFCLAVVWLALAMLVSIPFSCLLPVVPIGGLSQIVTFLYMATIAWLFFPMLLSAHGIFVYQDKMLVSLMKSIHLTRLTLPTTTIFLLLVLLATQGLGIVWRWPAENSWMVLIGLMGHSFITTGLLAGSFLYYREADQWTQKFLRQVLLRQAS